MAGDALGFEKEWLDKRVEFLLDRAESHLERAEKLLGGEEVRARACAATLYRDAAAIAFMRQDRAAGKSLLGKAGSHFLALGLPHGLLLNILASGGEEGLDTLARMMNAIADQDESSARRELGPLFSEALQHSEQLVALSAASAMLAPQAEMADQWEEPIRGRLFTYRTHPVGPSGVALATFMRVMDLGRNRRPFEFEGVASKELDMLTLFGQRAQQLTTAYSDDHHWRLLLSPAALLDFDLVALFSVWLAHGSQPQAMVPDMGGQVPPMMMLPMQVAQSLHGPRRSYRDE